MIASDFARDDCQVGKKRRTYNTLCREWVCNECGGRLVLKPPDERVDEQHAACGRCEGADFIHEAEKGRQAYEADEVMAGLPAKLRQLLEDEPRPQRTPEETLAYGRSILRE